MRFLAIGNSLRDFDEPIGEETVRLLQETVEAFPSSM